MQLLGGGEISYSGNTGQFVYYVNQSESVNETLLTGNYSEGNETMGNDSKGNETEEYVEEVGVAMNGNLAMDDLYTIVVIKDRPYADFLKELNIKGELKNITQINDTKYSVNVYYYSSNLVALYSHSDPFREHRNIIEHFIIISVDDISRHFLVQLMLDTFWGIDQDVIIVNQLIFTFMRQPGYLVRNDTQESWYWNRYSNEYAELVPSYKYDQYYSSYPGFVVSQICNKVVRVFEAIVGLAFVSLINALLIRVAIFCSQTLIFPLLWCFQRAQRQSGQIMDSYQIAAIYRASPHIGAQAAYLDRSGRSKASFVLSFFTCLIVFYFMFGACYDLWTQLIFRHILAKGINDIYFFYMNLVEFGVLFHVRTRSTIKYLPKYLIILNLIFIYYVNSYIYSAQYEMYSVLSNLTLALFLFFIKYYEQPSQTEWNPFGTYTPSISNPRTAYSLVSTDNFMLGFDILSMFQTVRFRHTFNHSEIQHYDLVSQQEILGYDFHPSEPGQRRGIAPQQHRNNHNNGGEVEMPELRRVDVESGVREDRVENDGSGDGLAVGDTFESSREATDAPFTLNI
ncbi:hypothetical protein FGO68_gene8871 [Halteria grandinella]|uniref:Uncharacterized protein n=1 Tax=Halteria grandinella TaxID=5974 RepID=A0A8J8NXW3_HALGN|nr:hypothetical protein FGO68_gene8871 [Halteria grandinella]